MRKIVAGLVLCLSLIGCKHKPDANTAVMLIESSPLSLDPRVGTDAQSERIDELIFDALVRRDEKFNLQPWVAKSWDIPDPLTYIFHLRNDVMFHDGRPLTSADVKWTLDSMLNGKLRTTRASTYRYVDHVEAPEAYTVVIKLREPFSALLWNLSDSAIGIVPQGAGEELARHPIGSGPFRFVSATPDREVIVERNEHYWANRPQIQRLRFNVVPDATTRALELRKGTADAAINSLGLDTVGTLQNDPNLVVEHSPGSTYQYLALNLRDPILKDVRVRQALAYAMDRAPLIHYLLHDTARPSNSLLPPDHWAYNASAPDYPHDPAKANALLDEAGLKRGPDGIRFHLTMKTSSDESARLLAAVLQQQLRTVGIALDIRSFEFATFYSDVVKGAFQLYSLRWIGGNQDPDMFEAVFDSASFPPKRFNRGYYSNPEVDRLVSEARRSVDQQQRARDYAQIQQIVNVDLPYINLWWIDNVLVHSRRLKNVHAAPSGNYDFLRDAKLDPK